MLFGLSCRNMRIFLIATRVPLSRTQVLARSRLVVPIMFITDPKTLYFLFLTIAKLMV